MIRSARPSLLDLSQVLLQSIQRDCFLKKKEKENKTSAHQSPKFAAAAAFSGPAGQVFAGKKCFRNDIASFDLGHTISNYKSIMFICQVCPE